MADHDTHDHTGIPGISSGSVATDPIWDAAGDLAVGTGANTAAKLVKGAAGGALSMINAAVAWNSGTSFPGSAVAGDRYWRTDLGMEFFFDGTRWVSLQIFHKEAIRRTPATATDDLATAISATSSGSARFATPHLQGGSNIWLVSARATFIVNSGGTALSGSHKWVGTVVALDSTPASTGTVTTFTIDSGSSGVWRNLDTAIGALQPANTIFYQTDWTKTGTPGTLVAHHTLYYRTVAT